MPTLRCTDLEALTVRILAVKGMSRDDAASVAASLDWADRRGIGSHGISFIPMYLKMIADGDLDPCARPALVGKAKGEIGPLILDAHRSAGAVAMTHALRIGLERATAAGVVNVWIRGMTHAGAMGYYVEQAAMTGCIASVTVAGTPFMAYHGATNPSATTGPIAMAVPGPGGEPIVFDMATSAISMARMRGARAAGKSLPPGAAIDAEGMATTDSALARTPLPISGPKGSGLALMFELMTSALLGNPIISDHLTPDSTRRHFQNAMLMIARVEAFRPLDAFIADVDATRIALKSQPRARGVEEILLPGERRTRALQACNAQAVPSVQIPAPLWTALTQIAMQLGVEVPDATD